ncbi:MAG: hypothetical protein NZM06_00730 [Chloroherpetonaceae bacterium]|nr:hypothetical protein [Chloroherpetonaceae bacterium]MDW8438128.1 hypothetical protein [Chloroherpetonaceae bacterium]
MKKILVVSLLVVALFLILAGSFLYFGSYSRGIRAGVVIKLSERGYLFKTYEGQLNIGTFGAFKNEDNQLTTVFEFSVPRDREDVIKALQEVSLTGERVSLHYEEKYFKFFWLGDTKYLITKVERLPAAERKALPPSDPPIPSGQGR